MTRKFIIFIVASFGSPAVAQFTNCMTTNGMTNCYTTPDYSQQQYSQPQYRRQPGEPTPAQNIAKLFRTDPKKKVGKLLAKGDCQGAIATALSSGDLQFATQVRGYCAGR